MIKVTALMVSKWVKAVFLVIVGIVILLYANRFVDDLRGAMEGNFDVAFEWTWDLIMILMWILVAWLFVAAALNVALSLTEHKYSLLDVMKRLDKIEKKLGVAEPAVKEPEHENVEVDEEEAAPEEEVPPPP